MGATLTDRFGFTQETPPVKRVQGDRATPALREPSVKDVEVERISDTRDQLHQGISPAKAREDVGNEGSTVQLGVGGHAVDERVTWKLASCRGRIDQQWLNPVGDIEGPAAGER